MSVGTADLIEIGAGSRLDLVPVPVGLEGLRLDGRKIDVRIISACQSAEEVETMEGASTFTMTLLDPEGTLEQSGLFDAAIDLELDPETDDDRPRVYRLVKLSSEPPLLTLLFEDRSVARLRAKRGYKKASRQKVTRVQFMASLAGEVKQDPITVYAPERDVRQAIAKEAEKAKKSKRVKGHRFPEGTDAEVKGVRATRAQLKVLDDVLEEGIDKGATRRVLIGAVMCITQESGAANLAGGDRDSVGAFQQRASMGWPASRNVRRDAAEFYKRAIPAFKTQPGRGIGWLVDSVQRSYTFGTGRQGADFEKWREEAENTVSEWLGTEGTGASGGLGTYSKRFEFRRGEPGKPEDSWSCMGRLADEVRWRRWMRRGVLWIASEKWLADRRAVMVLSRQSQGIQRISYEADSGKKAQTATVTMFARDLAALPGDVIALRGLSRSAIGRYLVASVRRNRFSPLVTVELKRPTMPLAEPAAETAERTESAGATTSGTGGESTGSLRWPTASRSVSSRFGPRSSPGGIGSRNHDGIDIGVATGTRVMAADGGKVTVAGSRGGYGLYVEIDHGGRTTFYGHLSQIEVRSGQRVGKGDLIARSGNTGASTGPHLHFGLHERGVPTDPMKALR